MHKKHWNLIRGSIVLCVVALFAFAAQAQLVDNTQAPNVAKGGINKSLQQEIGAGRGNVMTPDSSIFIIKRDPFRSVRRGRQLFQRKFTRLQGQGPNEGDGVGTIDTNIAIGAGLSDSCHRAAGAATARSLPRATTRCARRCGPPRS